MTEDDFVNYIQNTFPLFTEDDVSRVLLYYPSTNASVSMSTPDFATSGNSTLTALNESTFGSGQQQRADVRQIHLSSFALLAYLRVLIYGLIRHSERLRGNDLRLPCILARRSLHQQEPRSIQIPIQRHRRPARLRPILVSWPANSQPRS